MNNNKPNKHPETVAESLRRIWDAVESGSTPKLGSKFAKDYYRNLKALRELGDGNIEVGLKRWIEIQRQEHDQKRRDSAVYAMTEDMSNSANPVQRAIAGIAARLPEEDFEKFAKEALVEELARSAQELPQAENEANNNEMTDYDKLALRWVTRSDIPYQCVEEFLQKHAPEITKRTFYRRVLARAYQRGVIERGKGGRYVQKQ